MPIQKIVMAFGLILLGVSSAFAQRFSLGETVFVGLPSITIKDDAFIVGSVTRQLENGDYQIKVEDYVEGHDYGAFCQPVAVVQGDSQYGSGWELWRDTTQLNQPNLEYVVKGSSVMPYREGQHYYIERNNTWVVFGRWMSDAPILPVERLQRAKNDASSIGLAGMHDAFDLAIAHRYAFYEDGWGRPYWPYETVPYLNGLMDQVITLLERDKALNQIWRANPRGAENVKQDVRTYFLVVAIDKLVKDAYYQLYENLTEADPKQVAALEAKLKQLGKVKI